MIATVILLCRVPLVFLIAIAATLHAANAGARLVMENGYTGCIELSNGEARIVLEPNLGGRVLHYQLGGKEALYVDPAQDGSTYDPAKSMGDPPGGRMDIGPETTLARHPTLFLGKWTGEITGERSGRLTSQRDPGLDIVLVRDFHLAAQGAHVTVTQTIRNVGRETRRVFHWSRTLASPNGLCFVPLNPHSRYPRGFTVYRPGAVPGNAFIDFRPADEPNIRIRDGVLEFLGVPANPKYAIDSEAGWLAYATRNDLLFVKRFPVYPQRVYGEIAANSICIYYHPKFTELEPIGPVETLGAGQSVSYTEEWWLQPFEFPRDLKADLNGVRARVAAVAGNRAAQP